jgi:hypothetical protein
MEYILRLIQNKDRTPAYIRHDSAIPNFGIEHVVNGLQAGSKHFSQATLRVFATKITPVLKELWWYLSRCI